MIFVIKSLVKALLKFFKYHQINQKHLYLKKRILFCKIFIHFYIDVFILINSCIIFQIIFF